MTQPHRIAVVAGGLSQPSSTRMLADRLAEATMRPLFTYLRATPLSTGVFAASRDWGGESARHAAGSADAATGLRERIDRAGAELAAAVLASRREPADPFALPTGFSPVGAYGETR